MNEMDKDISGRLSAYREGSSIDLGKLETWIEAESPRITAQLPRVQFLKLRHGNDYARMAAIARLLPSCENRGSHVLHMLDMRVICAFGEPERAENGFWERLA
jgi:hypothetical protein